MIKRASLLIERSKTLICIPSSICRRRPSTADMLRSLDSRVTYHNTRISTLNYLLKRNIWKKNYSVLEREINKTLRKLINSTTKMRWRVRKVLILPLKLELLSTTSLSNSQELMILINSLILRLVILRARKANLLIVRVKLFNWKIKSLASKTSSITWKLLRRSIEMRMLIYKRELILKVQEILNSPTVSKSLRSKSRQRKTKLCIWEKNLKVLDIAILLFLITTLIFK